MGTDTSWSNNTRHIGGGDGNMWGAIKQDGSLWTWGFNEYGNLGLNQAGSNPSGAWRSSPTQLGTESTWSQVAQGLQLMAAATKTDGTLWTWGRNYNGNLGQGNNTQYSSPRQVGTDTTWATVQAAHAPGMCIATKTDGTLWTWGHNSTGKLGHNNNTHYSSPKQVGTQTNWAKTANFQMDMGAYHTAAINTSGSLFLWGSNNNGRLGINQPGPSARSSPTQIPGTWANVHTTGDAAGAAKDV